MYINIFYKSNIFPMAKAKIQKYANIAACKFDIDNDILSRPVDTETKNFADKLQMFESRRAGDHSILNNLIIAGE